jgi:hypothetical protein
MVGGTAGAVAACMGDGKYGGGVGVDVRGRLREILVISSLVYFRRIRNFVDLGVLRSI